MIWTTVLAFDIDPARRGLEEEADMLVWTFPPDYIERLRRTLLQINPHLTAAIEEGKDSPAGGD